MKWLLRPLAMWLVLLAAMILNGFFRVLVLEPRLGELRAHQAASLTGVAIIVLLAWSYVRGLPEPHGRLLLGVGALWLGLTIAFEFLFGRYAAGASWDDLLADYDVTAGRMWPLVLLAVLFAPWLSGLTRATGEGVPPGDARSAAAGGRGVQGGARDPSEPKWSQRIS